MSDDDPLEEDQAGTLIRIARTMGVSVASLFTTEVGFETAATDADDPTQAMALLRLFGRLKSSEARARCLAYVLQEAGRDD